VMPLPWGLGWATRGEALSRVEEVLRAGVPLVGWRGGRGGGRGHRSGCRLPGETGTPAQQRVQRHRGVQVQKYRGTEVQRYRGPRYEVPGTRYQERVTSHESRVTSVTCDV